MATSRSLFIFVLVTLSLICSFTKAESIFAAIPVDYNSSEVHFTLKLECSTTLCKPNTKFVIDAPPIDCATQLDADILWADSSMKVFKQRQATLFDWIIQSPFTAGIDFDNQTVYAYIRIIKDKTCPIDPVQSAEQGDVYLVINDTIRLSTQQYVATPPFIEADTQGGKIEYSRAMLKVFPPTHVTTTAATTTSTTTASSTQPKLELSVYLYPFADFNTLDTIELIPTGLWQLAPTAASQLKCIFFFEDANKDYMYLSWSKSPHGDYNSYLINVADHHVPTISSNVFITCTINDDKNEYYLPDLTLESNGLTIRYHSQFLQPEFEIQAFVAKQPPSTATNNVKLPQLNLIDLNTQVGPFNIERYPYFYHGESIHPIISRYAQYTDFDVTKPEYHSYYQFEYPVITPGDITQIDKIKDMFPCLMHEQYKFKFATQEYAKIDDPQTQIPTIEDVKKQIKQAQFSVSCISKDKKGRFTTQVAYVGTMNVTDVLVVPYLTDTSLPQYPLITLAPISQDETDFKDYATCQEYTIQIFLHLTSTNVPSTSTRNRGVFTLENKYDYATSRFEPNGGSIIDTAMFSLSAVSDLAAKQRFIQHYEVNELDFEVKSTKSNGGNEMHLETISFEIPRGNGEGEPTDRHDNSWSLGVMSPEHYFTTEKPSSTHIPVITCNISPTLSPEGKTVTVVVEPHHILVENYNLGHDDLNGKKVELKCDIKGNSLYLRSAIEKNKAEQHITLLLHQETVVTAPIQFKYNSTNKTGHIFRNILIVILVLLIIIAVAYLVLKKIKTYRKNNPKDTEAHEGLEAADYNVPGESGGYDNLQA